LARAREAFVAAGQEELAQQVTATLASRETPRPSGVKEGSLASRETPRPSGVKEGSLASRETPPAAPVREESPRRAAPVSEVDRAAVAGAARTDAIRPGPR